MLKYLNFRGRYFEEASGGPKNMYSMEVRNSLSLLTTYTALYRV